MLLVEDNPINQEVAEALLSAVGLTVETAGDGAQAVEQACAADFDLVLMDVQMPVMDGLQASRAIRARSGRGQAIIAMTANAIGEDRLACLVAGMNDHVAKPVDPDLLHATLLRWLPMPALPAAPDLPAGGALAGRSTGRLPLPVRLPGSTDVDWARALANLGDQGAMLVRVLRRFARTYADGGAALLAAATRGDGPALLAACHSLRGACAALTADGLLRQVQALESAQPEGAAGEAIVAQARGLHRALQQVATRLQAERDA